MILHTNKTIKIKHTNKTIRLPEDLKKQIDLFWKEQIKNNQHLFNGEDWNVTKMEELNNEIILHLEKTNYAHYLYDERHGIEEKYACHKISSGVFIETIDGYAVIGELDKNTSYPNCLQVSGGGIDKEDILNGEIDIVETAKRELKEELNIDLYSKKQIKNYKFKYIEIPEGTRHAYTIILKAISNLTARQLNKHFEEYKKWLEDNNKEIEFNKLYFLKIGHSVNELDKLDNPKRIYLRQLLEIEDKLKNVN